MEFPDWVQVKMKILQTGYRFASFPHYTHFFCRGFEDMNDEISSSLKEAEK